MIEPLTEAEERELRERNELHAGLSFRDVRRIWDTLDAVRAERDRMREALGKLREEMTYDAPGDRAVWIGYSKRLRDVIDAALEG